MKNSLERFSSLLFFVGVSLVPVYVFGSGGIQPAHFILAFFAGLTILVKGIPFPSWFFMLICAAVYFVAVESVYVLLGGEISYLINGVFFIYNALIAMAVYLHVREYGLSALVYGSGVAAIVVSLAIIFSGVSFREVEQAARSTGTFNNPNQLGYFSVCLLSLGYLFLWHKCISYWVGCCIFLVSLFLAISSLSKAAMGANFIVILLALKPAASSRGLMIWLCGASFGVGVILYLLIEGYFSGLVFIDRFASMASEGDSSLASRGYFAFLDGHALQIIFGLGSQEVNEVVGHEVHSTFASVLNNYGFVGLVFFALALSLWAIRLWKFYGFIGLFCLAAPAMIYGITHNGTRFTIFWVLFGASMAMAGQRDVRFSLDGTTSGTIVNPNFDSK